jgi:hypothetical protein
MHTRVLRGNKMERPTASLAVLIVAAMTVVAVPAAGLGPGTITGGPESVADTEGVEANATDTQTANGTDNETPPGSMLTGVVGVQKAEIEGEVQSRSFEIALNRSDDNASKAAIIAGEIADLESRLETLEERKDALDRARENNSIAEGEYRARIAEVSARISTVQRLANQTADASQGVPADMLNERGVNASTISEIRNRARNLSGPEVARIARGIAGPGVGMGLGRGPPANRTNPGQGNGPPGNGGGPPDDAGPGDGQRGGAEAGPPGSNDSNTGSNASSGDPAGSNGVDNGTAPANGG